MKTLVLMLLVIFVYYLMARLAKSSNEVSRSAKKAAPPISTSNTFSQKSNNIHNKNYNYPVKKDILNFLVHGSKIIIFDLETNGLSPKYSVLSCSAVKCEVDLYNYKISTIDRFNRYYYPIEDYEMRAIEINGLNEKEIERRRGGTTLYPKHFIHDNEFAIFCDGVSHYVAHNIDFDSRFVPFVKRNNTFCTMKVNTGVVSTRYLEWKNEYKWPTLAETAHHYGVSTNEFTFHESMSDVEITLKIFERMLDIAASRGESSAQYGDRESSVMRNHNSTC